MEILERRTLPQRPYSQMLWQALRYPLGEESKMRLTRGEKVYVTWVTTRKEATFARLSSFWAGETVEHAALVRSQV